MAATGAEKTLFDNADFGRMYKLAELFTGHFAEALVKQSGLPSSSLDELVVLDNACGTGIVTVKLHDGDVLDEAHRAKLKITCADFSEAMVNATKTRSTQNGWTNVETVLADAMDTKLPSSKYTHVLWNFGPQLLPHSMAGIRECGRMLQPDGVLGVTAWESVPWIDEFRPAFEKHPEFPPYPDRGQKLTSLFSETADAWDNIDQVKANLEKAGFVDVKIETVRYKRTLSVEDVMMTLPGMMHFIAKLWTQEQRDTFMQPAIKAVGDSLREKYGDKSVTWEFTASVATSRKPH